MHAWKCHAQQCGTAHVSLLYICCCLCSWVSLRVVSAQTTVSLTTCVGVRELRQQVSVQQQRGLNDERNNRDYRITCPLSQTFPEVNPVASSKCAFPYVSERLTIPCICGLFPTLLIGGSPSRYSATMMKDNALFAVGCMSLISAY